jgi:tetratricopeptide (TPR) repeat protein
MLRSKLRHLAFFEAMAAMENESVPEWPEAASGLLVLRVFDNWLKDGTAGMEENPWGMNAVRDQILMIGPGKPVRSILQGLMQAMARTEPEDLALVTPRLMAYGRALHQDAKWDMAADVYWTVIDSATAETEPETLIDAYMQFGYCARMANKWDEAGRAYEAAQSMAEASGDVVKLLRSRIAQAKLAIDRGNLPEAEEILDATITTASNSEKLRAVKAVALHDRAVVAHLKGDFEQAVHFGYDALSGTTDPAARDRVLSDVASSFMELGVLTAARDAFVVLASTAQEQYIRWAATINLMDVATRDGYEPAFEQCRRELADAALPPILAANLQLVLGRGLGAFGQKKFAGEAFTEAIRIATENRFFQLIYIAEAGLKELEGPPPAVAGTPATIPESLAPVASALSEMREAAGLVS